MLNLNIGLINLFKKIYSFLKVQFFNSLKSFPIKKSQPVGGYHDNHSPGPSRTVPRFPSSRTEGRKPIQCYGCGTPGVVKSKCPTCTRTNEIETEVNCMTLFNLNSDLYPSSVIVLKIFGKKIAVWADTGASHTIAGEKLFKFLQEHGITFTNKVISFMMADGIRQTITALRTVVDLYIEGKVIPTEFLVLPEAKGNKTLLGLDFLNAAGIVLDVQGGKWHFSENPRKQYKFFKKTLKDLNIRAFDLREDEAKHLSREQARKLNKLLDKNETCFQPGGEPTPFIEHLAHLPPATASLVRDVLMHPDATDPYAQIKNELINRSGESSQQEIRKLLSGEELGSRKPSELLRNMKRRAESLNVDDKLMTELFLQRLPSSVQTILAAVSDLTLDKAADIADRIFEVSPSPTENFSVSKEQSLESKLFREIEKLNQRIDRLSISRGRSPYRRNKNSRERSISNKRDFSICWFHRRFGKKCRDEKCIKPCTWQGNEASKE
ncbi:uncharacterized protein TNCT_138441 [Trichonephila clavata]|uniref:DUF7041 domain-containing protein n=1 Tax=Trichonephila clavata TaxID=2740835 RepID=A0A8X6FV07_TRICU|nr:uncharacterized protein TNCT_138441 [Trichonephila clavata]